MKSATCPTSGPAHGRSSVTSDNWLALFILSILVITAYMIATRPEITPEERKKMEEE